MHDGESEMMPMMMTKMMMTDLAGPLHFVIKLCIHMDLVVGPDYALDKIPLS